MLAIIQALPEAAMLLATDGDILVANRGAQAALGLSRGDDVGRSLTEIDKGSPDSLRATLRSWSRTTEPMPGSITVAGPSGAVGYSCRGSLVVPRADDTPAILLVRFWPKYARDPFVLLNQQIAALNDEVARRWRAEEALRETEQSLRQRVLEGERLNRAKDEFLATLGHELRTPLNAILGWSQMLRQGSLSTERRAQAAETIERNARAQAQVIEDLLDISTIVSGRLRLDLRQFEPAPIVEAAIESMRPAAHAKNIELRTTLDPHVGPYVGDPDRLRQVCWNLLSNAVKFTPEGGHIDVVMHRTDGSLELVVSDDGPGIAPEFLPYVFDRFRQQDASTTRSSGGLGLGLSIVKNIAELHGGTVDVASVPGEGASFSVRLPRRVMAIDVPEERARSMTRAPSHGEAPTGIEGLHLLIVDDDLDSLELLGLVLERAGAQISRASSAAAAFAALRAEHPDVLISDIGMPEEDGYGLIERVRRLAASAGGATPAIALTAFARPEDCRQALASGFQAHLAKPVARAELVSVISSLVRGSSSSANQLTH